MMVALGFSQLLAAAGEGAAGLSASSDHDVGPQSHPASLALLELPPLPLMAQSGGRIAGLKIEDEKLYATVGPRVMVFEPSEVRELELVAESDPFPSPLGELVVLPDGDVVTTGALAGQPRLLVFRQTDNSLSVVDHLDLPGEPIGLALQMAGDGGGARHSRILVATESSLVLVNYPWRDTLNDADVFSIPLRERPVSIDAQDGIAAVLTMDVDDRATVWEIRTDRVVLMLELGEGIRNPRLRLSIDQNRLYLTGSNQVLEFTERGALEVWQTPNLMPTGIVRDGVLYYPNWDGSVVAADPTRVAESSTLGSSDWVIERFPTLAGSAPLALSETWVALAVTAGSSHLYVGDVGDVSSGRSRTIRQLGMTTVLPGVEDVSVADRIVVTAGGSLWSLPATTELDITAATSYEFEREGEPVWLSRAAVSQSHLLGLEQKPRASRGIIWDRTAGSLRETISTARVNAAQIVEPYAYVTSWAGVVVLDLRSAADDMFIRSAAPLGEYSTFDADVHGDLLYLAVGDGLEIWNVSRPEIAFRLASASVPAVRVAAGRPLVAVGSGQGVTLLDASSRHTVAVISIIETGGVRDVELVGASLFVLDDLGVTEYDVSDPASPTPLRHASLGWFHGASAGNETDGQPYLATNGHVLAVAARAAGLWTFDIKPKVTIWLPTAVSK